MTIKQFIEKALEGGWEPPKGETIWDPQEGLLDHRMINSAEVLLDHKAWQAVGKVESWSSPCQLAFTMGFAHTGGDCCAHQGVTEKMHQMIDALIEGKTLEEHLETL